jgi:hypothetical protein
MPEPQACIEGLFADDPEFAVFEGLTIDQISQSMDDFIPELMRCVPKGAALNGVAELQLSVSCDGRVSAVSVNATQHLSPGLVECVSSTIRYASFPAHDTPAGVDFLYPMRFQF